MRVWAVGARWPGSSACGSLDGMFEKGKSELYFLKVALIQENVSSLWEKSSKQISVSFYHVYLHLGSVVLFICLFLICPSNLTRNQEYLEH